MENYKTTFPLNTDDAPLVYVYTGSEFPSYGNSSLKSSQKSSGTQIILLSDTPAPRTLTKGIKWVEIQDFYNPEPFQAFAETTKLPIQFRDGFWLHTAQRFFVLRDYMKFSNTEELFHAELDVLVYSLRALQTMLRGTLLKGIFMPRETRERIVASLIYVNSQSAMDQLCKEIISGSKLGNEMDILGALDNNSAPWLHHLATAEYLYRQYGEEDTRESWGVVSNGYEYVVDGAVIGRWLFGVDPRNTNFRGTQNLIQKQKNTVPFDLPLNLLKFRSPKNINNLRVRAGDGKWHDLVAIHVHSKIHSKLKPRKIRSISQRANRLRKTWIVLPGLRWYINFFGRIAKDVRLLFLSSELRTRYISRARSKKSRHHVG